MPAIIDQLREHFKEAVTFTFTDLWNERKDENGNDAVWRVGDDVHCTVNIRNNSDIRWLSVMGHVRQSYQTEFVRVSFGPVDIDPGTTVPVVADLKIHLQRPDPIARTVLLSKVKPGAVTDTFAMEGSEAPGLMRDVAALAQVTGAQADVSLIEFSDNSERFEHDILDD
jgi:hypothetical protein